MATKCDYPDNWAEIATAIKCSAGYRCQRCDLTCLPPGLSYRHLNLSLRRKLTAQVHHRDWNPSHNDRANLVCLCAGCHLGAHRHPKPDPQQLSLKLKLPKIKTSRRRASYCQLTLTDLIAYLPQLPLPLYSQLELDLGGNL
jgi:5-methylcytosine-specific restriction endonuclease McrA